ncbi:hypothetical protein EDB92DRAFT_1953369 [Lactarius akahatsu]|uniref:DUF6534 domain-containing protein n=1 Tax=Lactarius akahatsu TaxID=416441 RepID=A0AAD4L877_9AGAM|nr:hypothetical protein EDB92DRAFT_1953369 [Lactarius akahatsu]
MAENSNSRTAYPDVTKVAAPLLLGPLFNWTLYGVLCVQMYVYSYNFPKDRRSIKFLAYFVFLLDTAQTALTGADIYYWFVEGFGDVERLKRSHFSPIDSPITTTVISFIVQGYFCYRIWLLNKRSLWICLIIAISAVTQVVAAIWLGTTSLIAGKYVVTKAGVYLWSIPSALADILIAVAMTLLLRVASSNFSSFVLIRVVRLTIETNTLTASLAITILVLYAAFPVSRAEIDYEPPSDLITFFPGTKVIGKVYSNTLLVSLNNRIYFREHLLPEHGDSPHPMISDRVRATALSSLHFAVPEPRPRTPTIDNYSVPPTGEPRQQ